MAGCLGRLFSGPAESSMPMVDKLLARFAPVRASPLQAKVEFSADELEWLCGAAEEAFASQPMLLELEAPLNIVGTVRGHLDDLLHVFSIGGDPPVRRYLFLGSYINSRPGRGHDLETLALLLCLKVKYPDHVYLLRGQHECDSLARIYGFWDECKKKWNVKICKRICKVFEWMPLAAFVGRERRFFCVHSGLSPYFESFDEIRNVERPHKLPDWGFFTDLLWACPDPAKGWVELHESVASADFGPDIVESFCSKHGIDMIVRSNQVVEDGYEFFADKRLVTIHSASNYSDFENGASFMQLNEDMTYKIHTWRLTPPIPKSRPCRSGAPATVASATASTDPALANPSNPSPEVSNTNNEATPGVSGSVAELRRSNSTERLLQLPCPTRSSDSRKSL